MQEAGDGEPHQSVDADASLIGELNQRLVLARIELADTDPTPDIRRQTRTTAASGFWGHSMKLSS